MERLGVWGACCTGSRQLHLLAVLQLHRQLKFVECFVSAELLSRVYYVTCAQLRVSCQLAPLYILCLYQCCCFPGAVQ